MAKSGGPSDEGNAQRFSPDVLYRVACLYYQEDRNQADIASLLQISRATVSRLLSLARDRGIVRIDVINPSGEGLDALAERLARRLGLERAVVTSSVLGTPPGSVLAPAVAELLAEAELQPADVLLVSSGETMFSIGREPLGTLPGVFVVPSVGGHDEPEEYYQTNEISRRIAVGLGAIPVLLHAPVQATAELYRVLQQDPGMQRVTGLWNRARAALLGIGLPPRDRSSLPSVITRNGADLTMAVGDLCTRPFDIDGNEVGYPGSERVVAIELDLLRRIDFAIGVAVGVGKAQSIATAARAGFINRLVTDASTAEAILSLRPGTK